MPTPRIKPEPTVRGRKPTTPAKAVNATPTKKTSTKKAPQTSKNDIILHDNVPPSRRGNANMGAPRLNVIDENIVDMLKANPKKWFDVLWTSSTSPHAFAQYVRSGRSYLGRNWDARVRKMENGDTFLWLSYTGRRKG